jgi:hypothetical protein
LDFGFGEIGKEKDRVGGDEMRSSIGAALRLLGKGKALLSIRLGWALGLVGGDPRPIVLVVRIGFPELARASDFD